MDNPEKPATQDTVRRKKHNTEDQKDYQHEPQQDPRVNPSARGKGKQSPHTTRHPPCHSNRTNY